MHNHGDEHRVWSDTVNEVVAKRAKRNLEDPRIDLPRDSRILRQPRNSAPNLGYKARVAAGTLAAEIVRRMLQILLCPIKE